MKRSPFIVFLLVLNCHYSFSQNSDWNKREINTGFIEGLSFGFLVQGQTKYPTPYYGPEIKGLYNDGSYHIMLDLYIKKLILGFQLSDEFLYIENFEDVLLDNNGVITSSTLWKPRGYNGSFSALTRTLWISLGYVIFDKLNLKISTGFRKGPAESIFLKNKLAEQVALGYNYNNPDVIYNTSSDTQNSFSEVDFSVSLNYPINIYGRFGVVPEIGYSINYGGLMSGIALKYTIPERSKSD
ncbi:hypothetical protein N9H57_04270 [Flavobacteriaceae bacterium]|nr:hypothetical protein [Flavobacteriaceae bacterium]MDA9015686.1 hypothetical protein [Flavobacteriaceae bacterium]MDC3354602.1 hypothetical protein [Flavobacteriaceae bacterium]